jgi:hypothetical protein
MTGNVRKSRDTCDTLSQRSLEHPRHLTSLSDHNASLHFRHAEARVFAGDDKVTAQNELEAACKRTAVDGRDDRLACVRRRHVVSAGQGPEAVPRVDELLDFIRVVTLLALVPAVVEAGKRGY